MLLGISGIAGSGKDTAADFLVKNFGFTKLSFADVLKRIVQEVFDFSEEQLWGPSNMRSMPDPRYTMKEGKGLNLSSRVVLQSIGTWGRSLYQDIWVEYTLRVANQLLVNSELDYSSKKGLFPSGAKKVIAKAQLEIDSSWNPKQINLFQNNDFVLEVGMNINVLEESGDYCLVEYKGKKFWVGRMWLNYIQPGVVISDVRYRNEFDAIKNNEGTLIRIKRPGAGLKGKSAVHSSEKEQLTIQDEEFDFIIDNSGTLSDLEKRVGEIIGCKAGIYSES